VINKKIKTLEIISALAAVITIICTITSIIFSYYYRDEKTANMAEFLVKISHFYSKMKIDAILSLVCGIFLILVAFGFFSFLRRKLEETKKKFALIPLISIIFGSLFMISISALQIYLVYYITPKYIGGNFAEQPYFLAKAINTDFIAKILAVFTHVITFTIGAGSIAILLYNKKIIPDVFVWTALTTSVFGLAKIGYFLTGSFGTILAFLASIGSIFFYFFLGEMVYVLFKDLYSDNGNKKNKSIDASLLE